MSKVIIYLLLIALCIDTFGALIGEFAHVVTHLIQDSQYSTHLHQITYTHAHTEDALASEEDVHSHHYSLYLILDKPEVDKGETPSSDSDYINLLMLSLKGIIDATPNFLQVSLSLIDKTIAFTERPFLDVYRKIPYPPPRFFESCFPTA
ncbi:MAG: hypothetical protein AAF849_14305 [Bacteroidota bacterium]